MTVPTFNPFRPFWLADNTQLERLSQKLDAAEKKIIEYAQLIASLYAEQKRYQDIICHSCREKIYRASVSTASPPASSGFPQSTSQPILVAPQDPGQIGATSSAAGPPLQSAPFSASQSSAINQPALGHSPGAYGNSNPDGLNFATSSPDNPPATVTTTAAIRLY